jgi:hypothetical protein
MIVWGGETRNGVGAGAGLKNELDGAAYDPSTNTWQTIAPGPASMSNGSGFATAWSGRTALFWTGNSLDGLAQGGMFDPTRDSWQLLPKGPTPGPCQGYASVWTTGEDFVFGGYCGDGFAKPPVVAIDPAAGIWRIPTLDALFGYLPNGGVWAGHKAYLMGKVSGCPAQGSACQDYSPLFVSYTPLMNKLAEIDLKGAPLTASQLSDLTPVAWYKGEVVFFAAKAPAPGMVFYRPAAASWRIGAPEPCAPETTTDLQTAWIGNRFVVPCGANRLQIYDPAADSWQVLEAGRSPLNDLSGSAIVWTGKYLIVWSGWDLNANDPAPNTGSFIDLSS